MSQRGIRVGLLCVVLSALLPFLCAQRFAPVRPAPAYVPGQIVVGFAGEAPAAAGLEVAAALGARPGRRLPQISVQAFHLPQSEAPQGVLARVKALPGVRFVEPNYRRRVLLADPNDPAYNQIDTSVAVLFYEPGDPATWFQWGLHTMEAVAAWNIYPGTYYTQATKPPNPPKIAVIDTGIDLGGADGLAQKDFMNAGGTSVDSALGGQIDVAEGHNVLPGADPTDFADDFGHGTAVASIAAGAANNGTSYGGIAGGMAGLGYHAQILPVKAIDATGNGTDLDLAAGILWATDHGANVISISAGDYYYSEAEQEAIDYAWAHGALVIAAAGNEGDGANKPLYPAALDSVIAVGATGYNGESGTDDLPASYTNFGYYLTVAAPGGDATLDMVTLKATLWGVWCALPTEDVPMKYAGLPDGNVKYQYHVGTSAAAPHVAGLASLYAAKNGITQSTPNGPLLIWRALCRNCDDIMGVPGWHPYAGWGRINAYHTLLDDGNRGTALGGLKGQVRYKGTAVANAIVRARLSGLAAGVASTHGDGIYTLPNLTPGVYDLTATYQGTSQTLHNVVVEAGYELPRVRFDIGADPPGTPVLSWLGTTGYEQDGVDPDIQKNGARCTFRVRYADPEGTAPVGGVRLHLLREGAEITGSPFAMTLAAAGDVRVGVVYRHGRPLTWGDYSYYFEATDGTQGTIGDPTQSHAGPEVITGPLLELPEVHPTSGPASTIFRYWIDYSSVDEKPADWIDLEIGTYAAATGWQTFAFRRRNVVSGSSRVWRVQVGTRYPTATQFRFRFRASKGPTALGLTALTPWTAGPVVSQAAATVFSSLSALSTSAGGAEIVFSLSAPAEVSTMVTNIAGRPVRAVAATACSAGLNRMVWDGKSDVGLSVPGGVYLVQVTARAADGTHSRALARLQLTR